MIENTQITGFYTFTDIDKSDNIISSTKQENMVVNEGIYFLVKSMLERELSTINWEMRIGTGRNFTTLTDSYNNFDTEDTEIITFDIGSAFFNNISNIITLNGIVLSNEGFVETVQYDADTPVRENEVTIGQKIEEFYFHNFQGDIYVPKNSQTIETEEKRKYVELFAAAEENDNLTVKQVGLNMLKSIEDVKIPVLEMNGWINDVNEDIKWNNISLIANLDGDRKYLISRAVLPPLFKCKGVRMICSYDLML